VGNRTDILEKKVVQTEDAQKLADEIGIQLYETSAKENLNVEEVGIWLGTRFMDDQWICI
jgi:Ras-related protein Rab-35